jgi:phage portal protein BeeE
MAHWSPLPDPECAGVGMSWVTPALREIQGDRMATDHKVRFFENGATPNLVVKGITAATKDQFDELVDAMEANHAGVANAYRTLYLTAGADASVVGVD